MTELKFRNELIKRLNNNATRYVGGYCNGKFYPEMETFDVDEIYEIIDRVFDKIPEDDSECESKEVKSNIKINSNCKHLLDVDEFQRKILDYVTSEEINKCFEATIFADNSEYVMCKRAMIYGMVIAAMLTSSCTIFVADNM